MTHTYFAVYEHIVFSTKGRREYFTPQVEKELFPYLAKALENQGCRAVIVGGHQNHVHLLVGMPKETATPDLVKEIKRSSSLWLKTKGDESADFAWQTGYGAFSVSYSNLDQVKDYIANQEEHHRTMPWDEEYRAMLQRHGVEFDDRFYLD